MRTLSQASDPRLRPWWAPSLAMLVASVALAAALLIPRLFSDPVGVDPHVLRLSAVAVGMAGAALLWGKLEPTSPMLLTVATMTVAFSVFAGAPQWLVDLTGNRFDGNAQVLVASAAEALVTVLGAFLVLRWATLSDRPQLRLRRFGRAGTVATLAGVLLFVAIVMVLPATFLGRVGIAPVALARDLPLQAPASALQALTQELQFRGMLLGILERVAPPWLANLGQAAFFGLAHIAVQYQGPAAALVPVTVVLGLGLGWITQRSGSLWPAVLIHAVADVAVTVGVTPGLYG